MVKISIALHMSTYLYVYKYKELGYDHIEYLKRIRRILRGFLTFMHLRHLCSFVNSDSHTQNILWDGQKKFF